MNREVDEDDGRGEVDEEVKTSEDERGLDFGNAKDDGVEEEEEGSVEEERQGFNVGRRRRIVVKGNQLDDGAAEEEEEDDEANYDLSLLIVEKAMKRQKVEVRGRGEEEAVVIEASAERVQDEQITDIRGSVGNSVPEDEGKEPLSRSETPEEGELQEDGEGNLVLAADLFEAEEGPDEGGGKKKKKKKKEKKEKKKKKKGGDSEQNKGKEKSHGKEVKLLDAQESIVMRKLLRGPRYFDPPEEQDQTCFNCGKVGHLAVDCSEGRRLKPCYVCGTFGHDGRECPQKTDCYVCGKVGHIAKNCPNKGQLRSPAGRDNDNTCLLCGRSGHEASTCYHNYDAQDLEQVQCYICKEFGHLSCIDIIDTSPVPVSCYQCGEMGHTGLGCARTRRADRGDKDRPASLCFKCGEEGHFARGCSKQRRGPWPPPWSSEEQGFSGIDLTTPSPKYQRRNSGALPRWMDLQQREGRWTPPSRSHPLDPLGGYRALGSSSKRKHESQDNDEDYMGPIDNFVSNPKDSFKSRRRKSWTAGGGRKRS